LTCGEILNEFSEKLVIKLKLSQEMAQAAVEEICSFSQAVEITTKLKVVSVDPDDDRVIECAVVGGATHTAPYGTKWLALYQIAFTDRRRAHLQAPLILPDYSNPCC
jgi:predicted nucleic acid-binding protein